MIETVRKAGRAIVLFCLAALALLAIVQLYSGEAYHSVERILAALLIITLIVLAFLLAVEVWRWKRPN
jgi:Mn2+/Fe2+ NRAMP family transporter